MKFSVAALISIISCVLFAAAAEAFTQGAAVVFVTQKTGIDNQVDATSIVSNALDEASLPSATHYVVNDRVQLVLDTPSRGAPKQSRWEITVSFINNATAQRIYNLRNNKTVLSQLTLSDIKLPRDINIPYESRPVAFSVGTALTVVVILGFVAVFIVFAIRYSKTTEEEAEAAAGKSGGKSPFTSAPQEDVGIMPVSSADSDSAVAAPQSNYHSCDSDTGASVAMGAAATAAAAHQPKQEEIMQHDSNSSLNPDM